MPSRYLLLLVLAGFWFVFPRDLSAQCPGYTTQTIVCGQNVCSFVNSPTDYSNYTDWTATEDYCCGPDSPLPDYHPGPFCSSAAVAAAEVTKFINDSTDGLERTPILVANCGGNFVMLIPGSTFISRGATRDRHNSSLIDVVPITFQPDLR